MGHSSERTLHASPAQLALSAFALMALVLSLFAFANPVRAEHNDSHLTEKYVTAVNGEPVTDPNFGAGNGFVFVETGDLVTFTIVIEEQAASSTVDISDVYKKNQFEFVSSSGAICDLPVDVDGGDSKVDCTVTTDASGDASLTLTFKVIAPGSSGEGCPTITNTAHIGDEENNLSDVAQVKVCNEPDLNLIKKDDDGRFLANVSFTLTPQDGTPITLSTNAQGAINFEDVGAGTFTLTETAPAGCVGIGTLTVAIAADGSVTVTNLPASVTISGNTLTIVNDCGSPLNLVKLNQSGTALAGVSFTLTATGQTGTTLLTNAEGRLTFLDLDPGNYTLSETAPAGCTGIGSITLSIAANGNVTLSAANVAVTGNTLTITNNCPPPLTPTLVIDKVANVETIAIVDGVATPPTITWTLSYTLTNGPVTGAVITDTLPTGLDYVAGSATPAAGFSLSADGRTLTWNFATLSTSGSVSFQTSVNVATILSPTVNLATIDSNQTTPDTGQDQVTVTRQSTAGGNPPVRESTLAASVPNTAMDGPMNQLPVVFLALLTLGSLGYLGRRNLMGVRNRR